MTEIMNRTYGLFDAALIPQVWTHLDYWQLNYEPLYRYDYAPIAEAIPYLIELDSSIDADAVNDLLTQEDYHSALLMSSELDLSALVKKLGYFYHINDEDNQPFLRRFFDLRIFNRFLSSLTEPLQNYLFADNTVFYYLDESKNFYHCVSHYDKNLVFSSLESSYFLKLSDSTTNHNEKNS